MKIATIIQARMGSSRLPGKIILDLNGKPVLQRVIERCQASSVKDVIVATPNDTKNQLQKVKFSNIPFFVEIPTDGQKPILNLCNKLHIPVHQGSEDNVLDRTYKTAKKFNLDLIVDVTSDCPLVDPGIIDKLINSKMVDNKGHIDYASNVINRTFSAGFDVQVYTFKALAQLWEMSKTDKRIITEHSGWNFTQLNRFYQHSFVAPTEYQLPAWRLTLDTRKDYELINWLYSVMGDEIWDYKRIIDYLKDNTMDFLSYDSMADQACFNSSH